MSIALLLSYYTKNVVMGGTRTSVAYTYPILYSGLQIGLSPSAGNMQYYVALTAEGILSGVTGNIFPSSSQSIVGLVFSAQYISFTNCHVKFHKIYSSQGKAIVGQAVSVSLVNSTIDFYDTSYNKLTISMAIGETTAVTTENGETTLYQSIDSKGYQAPCTACISDASSISDNCFGCKLGEKVTSQKTCECQFSGSVMDTSSNSCQNQVSDSVSEGDYSYYSVCVKNMQLTMTRAAPTTSTTYISTLKDDLCGISNLYITGTLYAEQGTQYASGLVITQTTTITYVYSTLTLSINADLNAAAMIAINFTKSVATSYITLNGKISDALQASNSNCPIGGIYASTTATTTVTGDSGDTEVANTVNMQHLRFFGFNLLVMYKSNIGMVVGLDNGAKFTVNDLIIGTFEDTNYTMTIVDPSLKSFDNVDFKCKSSAQSDALKDSMKTQLIMNEHYDSSQALPSINYYLNNAGLLVGKSGSGSMEFKNVAIKGNVTASPHYYWGYNNIGMLIGYMVGTNFSLSNCYVGGNVVGYDYIGVIGYLQNANVSAVLASDCYLDGDYQGGIFGYCQSTTFPDIKVALNVNINSYLYYTGVFGTLSNCQATISEAIGWIYQSWANSVYVYSAYGSTLNGQTAQSQTTSLDGMYLNNCS